MEDKEPKKINDDLITFMKKRSDSEVPRYSERLKNYVTIQHRRAAAAKRAQERRPASRRSREAEGKDGESAVTDQQGNEDSGRGMRRGRTKDMAHSGGRTRSGSASGEPQERCGGRRRRRGRRRSRRRRRRRRSRRRRGRRRRRSCRRRRRRSRSRRRRRRSCRRRRRRRRRRC